MFNNCGLPEQDAERRRASGGSPMDTRKTIASSRRRSLLDRANGAADTSTRDTEPAASTRVDDLLPPHALNRIHGSDHAPFRRILLLYDSSPAAEKTLQLGLDVACCFKAKLLIVGVIPLPDGPELSELQMTIESTHARLSRKFYEIRLSAMNEGLWVETMLALGDPVQLTVRNAERFRASLIIVGHSEASLTSASAMHSVSDAVLARAPCPVLVAESA